MHFISRVAMIAVVALVGCSGANHVSSTPATQDHTLSLNRLSQTLRRTPPSGSRVYVEHSIVVTDGNQVQSFPSTAQVSHSATGVVVTIGSRSFTFSSSAKIAAGPTVRYVIPPGARLPAFLASRQPNYIAK